jgi:dephospho-CoA kinase|tara:strand:+ start:29810 stop:30346 length:537 start_codon:yes stop_codon:yes gene_type:complete
MIIGLTGKNAAGKGEVANYLKSKGFIYYSLSDVIREEATKRGLDHSRENLINIGNELRTNHGPNYLAQQINEKIKQQTKNFVIDSIRSPHEAKELMKNKDFILIGIGAPIELRFNRLLERNRLGDAKTLEDFKKQEEKENTSDETSQQLDATFKMSHKTIVNNGTLDELHKKIETLLK